MFVKRCYCSCHYSIAVFTYSRRYLCRRIPHASNGSFNPYVITNKHAHIINGNIFSTDKKDMENKCVRISTEAYAASSTTPQFTTVPRHFINYCFKHPGKFSCVVDCFLELSCVIFVCCGKLTATHFLKYYTTHVYYYKTAMFIQIWSCCENLSGLGQDNIAHCLLICLQMQCLVTYLD